KYFFMLTRLASFVLRLATDLRLATVLCPASCVSCLHVLESDQRRISISERPDQLVAEVIRALTNVMGHALLVHHAGASDFAAQPRREIAVAPPFDHRLLVIQLDLRHEQPRIALRRHVL